MCSLPYKKGETILLPAKFVATQLEALDTMLEHTRAFKNAYQRLSELKLYLKTHPL